jgi:acetyl esterase/lipase
MCSLRCGVSTHIISLCFVADAIALAIYAGDKFADPYASVLLAPVSKTHPPVHITVCGCDALRDEGIAYAMKLRDAGVDAQLEIVPGVPHGLNVSPKTHVAKQWYRNLVRVLNCALNTDF